MESIKQKLLKIKTLAERGVEGEAIAARNQLAKLLAKYGMTIDDLCTETKTDRTIKIKRDESALFRQTLWMATGERNRTICIYKGGSKLLKVVEMTDREYIEFDMLFTFHRRQPAKERKRALDTLYLAYIHKHRIFGPDDGEERRSVLTQEEIMAMQRMMRTLDDAAFRRPLAGKALPPSKQ